MDGRRIYLIKQIIATVPLRWLPLKQCTRTFSDLHSSKNWSKGAKNSIICASVFNFWGLNEERSKGKFVFDLGDGVFEQSTVLVILYAERMGGVRQSEVPM